MRLHHSFIVLSLIAALPACTSTQDKNPEARPAQHLSPTKVPNPMARFARMMPGQWKMTSQAGTSLYDTWHWGPANHSMRVMTDGFGADGNPWRQLQVLYWHPARKQICLLGVSAFARGVMEGTIKFEGETADAVFDLYQTGGRRKIERRWVFDGPDKYRATLLEATDRDHFIPLAGADWDYVRIKTRDPTPAAKEAPKFPERLKALEPFLGHTWEAKGNWANGDALHTKSTFEWVPHADGIYACVLAPSKSGDPTHLLDAYFYHHTGTGVLRCLALSNRGAVYEGDLTLLDGGALQLDLKAYEDDRISNHVVRFDFEQDRTVRHRLWSLKGTERTLILDVHHKRLLNPSIRE